MQIGELAELSGLSRDALRFYEKRGLIQAHRRPNGYRHYPPETLFVLDYVRMAQRLGFSLAEIESELPLLARGGLSSERAAAILREKISMIDARIGELGKLRTALAERLESACPLSLESQSARTAM